MSVFVCAGAKRTGSTWLFNAMRLIAAPCLAVPYDRYIAFDTSERHVVKTHAYVESLRGIVIMTQRNESDQIESAIRFGMTTREESAEWIEAQRRSEYAWKTRASLVVDYGNIISQPENMVQVIANSMGIEVDAKTIAAQLTSLSDQPTNGEWDPITLLRRNHRTCQPSTT